MQLDVQSLDSVTGPVAGPTIAPASPPLTDAWAAARPGTLALVGLPPHHSGWTLEFDGPTLLVFRRALRAVGTTGTERLSIQVPALSLHTPASTPVDYVLTRRF